METAYKGVRLIVVQGDLTAQKTDAIVNPANSKGTMGGGVALAIKEAGGEQIEKDAVANAPTRMGKAIATSAGRLPCRYVFHAPTMVLPGEKTNAKAAYQATAAALLLAAQMNLKSIAFPGMGTGVGAVPVDEAAHAMVNAAKFFIDENEGRNPVKEILFVAFDAVLENAFAAQVAKLGPARPA
ncbi:MAG: macro domain-containing protein [Candidatus Micrarchaeota archaeon]|nr:macro domain-containing protein [Candidatus Micrarchaeota archaeon]